EATTVVELAERYRPGRGVLGALLRNRVVLQPGEAIYLGPGHMHAYLRGVGVEVMANSDNVLRGGLTPKHVDVPELMRVLEFSPLRDPRVRPVPAGRGIGTEVDFPTPAPDFALSRIDLEPGAEPVSYRPVGPEGLLCTSGTVRVGGAGRGSGAEVDCPRPAPDVALSRMDGGPGAEPGSYRPVGPEVLLCTSGTVRVGHASTSETLGPGRAAWLAASTPVVTLESSDWASVFRTRVGDGESAARRP